jgi:hypothetical protein
MCQWIKLGVITWAWHVGVKEKFLQNIKRRDQKVQKCENIDQIGQLL